MLDYLAIAALTQELDQRLLGARVQAVIPLDRLSLGFELFADGRWYLQVSADPQQGGVALQRTRLRRGGNVTPLSLAARSRLVGSRLQAIDQPPWERVLHLVFEGEGTFSLIAELVGRLGNLLLVDGQSQVLAVARPVTSSKNRARTVLPGRPYVPPPAPARPVPPDITVEVMSDWFAAEPRQTAWRLLCDRLRAVSPLAAREVVHRALLSSTAAREVAPLQGQESRPAEVATAAMVSPGACHQALMELFALPQKGAWRPGICRSATGVLAFAPYELLHLPNWQPTDSLLSAIALWQEGCQPADPYARARQAVGLELERLRSRAARRLANLQAQSPDLQAAEIDRLKGDLILAHRHALQPGQVTLIVPGMEPDSEWLIELDPALSAVANAQRYYGRYRRARRAALALPALIEAARSDLAGLDQLATDLALAENRASIEAVRELLPISSPARQDRPARPRRSGSPLRLLSPDGLTILVGRNALENERLTFELAHRDDLWLHAQDVPGGHVVIQSRGRDVPADTLEMAAGLAAYYSRARSERRVAVAVTRVRNVRRLPGGVPGMVRYRQAKTLVVRPRAPAVP